ncbi:MAG: hypothetical protein HY806_00405 [Nitrospirae bacterium]|nr:hypothetical protein [Nitrospirota bacterium]
MIPVFTGMTSFRIKLSGHVTCHTCEGRYPDILPVKTGNDIKKYWIPAYNLLE